MNQSRNIDGLLSRASERLAWVAVAAVGGLIIALIVIMVALKGAVEQVEDQLRYQAPRGASADVEMSGGLLAIHQTVYVPVYSHVYIHEGTSYNLTTTVSVRNCDTTQPLIVKAVRYHGSDGQLIQSYLEQPLKIGPLATTEFLVSETDSRGGSGASFLIEWAAMEQIHPPIVEAVMVGASGQQGISLMSRGIVIDEDNGAGN